MAPVPAMSDKPKVMATYSAAADHFDGLPFWHEFGGRTVRRLQLPAGARVLDLCCGTGASALPAARAVGPSGSVLGVDLTPALVVQAAATARAAGLDQARFEVGDVETLTFAPASFDAVLSVFGWFFLADMALVLRRAWDWLAPGGQLGSHRVERGNAGARRGNLLGGGGARGRHARSDQPGRSPVHAGRPHCPLR